MFGDTYRNSLNDLPLFNNIKKQLEQNRDKEKKSPRTLTHNKNERTRIRSNRYMHSLNAYSASRSQPLRYSRNMKGKIDYLNVEVENENRRRNQLRSLGGNIFKPIGFESRGKEPEVIKQQVLTNSIYDSLWNRTSITHLSNIESPFMIQGCISSDGNVEFNCDEVEENQASNMSLERRGNNIPGRNELNFRFHESFQTSNIVAVEHSGIDTFDNANILGLTIQEPEDDEQREEDENESWDEENAICYDDDTI
ncbi:similar to Saccharomyces cerevisiae YIR025W MND2 Subunit of the anaphase-promoting complex (APC) [Maudiozyma saulgeensis]|uniref:Similar to Saccharomyces cerevisiae YIR025W MND2 Subunit of the anaphase-promoting complex (APC) n=1 Tax=Maudiozyma saulgeensis TaxID=1789683 RepID=A0A1X7RAE3_9SACH|nr:similar to Saccharomyces cerevisiae YIR025W MND2 Subunit of the anaphase-promoting complex (APC) [Kazachstania saulgeensis]